MKSPTPNGAGSIPEPATFPPKRKRGQPRKNRRVYLSRVSPECLANFQTLATLIAPHGKNPSLVDAIEHAAQLALTHELLSARLRH
jgi:hypothetical protein